MSTPINISNYITTVQNDLKNITYAGIINTGDDIYFLYGNHAFKVLDSNIDSLNEELAKEFNLYEKLVGFELDADGNYDSIQISIVYSYHFNDGSSIDYNCIDNEFYYESNYGNVSEDEFNTAEIDRSTLAWKYYNDVLIDQILSDYAESNNLSNPEQPPEEHYYYWKDPDGITSDICKIISFPNSDSLFGSFKENPFDYDDEAIFVIQKNDNGEAEVTNSELTQNKQYDWWILSRTDMDKEIIPSPKLIAYAYARLSVNPEDVKNFTFLQDSLNMNIQEAIKVIASYGESAVQKQ